MIRITGGKYRSRLLVTPEGNLTKPTMDKVRSAVFSALNDANFDNCLDLFAGSGSYGFEALSRGAKKVTFVDKSNEAIKAIKLNASKLEISDCEIINGDVFSYLNNVENKFNIIFIDPPYKLETYSKLVEIILEKDLLADRGIIVLESEKELELPFDRFAKYKFYKYGLAKIYILRK